MAKTVRAHGHTSDTSMRCQDPECREPVTWSVVVTEMTLVERVLRTYGSLALAIALFVFALNIARAEGDSGYTVWPAILLSAGLFLFAYSLRSTR